MKNIILILTAALSLMAEEPKTNLTIIDTELDTKEGDESQAIFLVNTNQLTEPHITFKDVLSDLIAVTLSKNVTNAIWHLDESQTNQAILAPWIKVETNWATIERITNASPVLLRQIGHVQTNQMLTLIYQGRTNHLVIGVVGKGEWPDQKQVIAEPRPQQPAPAARRTK